jgi:hypothetical protein
VADKEISDLTSGGAATTGDKVHAFRTPNSRGVTLGSAAGKDVGTGSGTVAAGDHTHSTATTSDPGFMSASDKTKLNGVESGADVTDADNVAAAGALMASALDTDGTLAANSDTKVATQKAVKTYADQLIAAADAMVFKGTIDCSANPNYPAADKGNTYRVSVAGKIGGGSGVNVEAGDLLICLADSTSAGNQATVGSSWSIAQANLDGVVIGPSSVTDANPAVFDGTTGKLLKQITYSAFKTALSLTKGDVGLGSVTNDAQVKESLLTTRGDIIYRDASGSQRLAKGSFGQVLTMGADDPGWAAAGGSVSGTSFASGSLSGSSVAITGIPATYRWLVLTIAGGGVNAISKTVTVEYSVDNGSSYKTSIGDYQGDVSTSMLQLKGGSGGTTGLNGYIRIDGVNIGQATSFFSAGKAGNGTGAGAVGGIGFAVNAAQINALRIRTDSGSFNAGTYELVGYN